MGSLIPTSSGRLVLQYRWNFIEIFFALAPNHINLQDFIAPVENSISKLPNNNLASSIRNDVISALKYSKISNSNIPINELKALRTLKDKNLVILPADKGKAIVVFDSQQYINKVEHMIIEDTTTYQPLNSDPTNSILRKLDDILKPLLQKGEITKQHFNACRNIHSVYPQLYCTPKVHKEGMPMRPIVCFINTPLTKASKMLANLIKLLTTDEHRVRDASTLLSTINSDLDTLVDKHWATLDIESLYTKSDINKAINFTLNGMKENPEILEEAQMSYNAFETLLKFCTNNSYFEFNGKFYRQLTGGPMGSSLTVELAEMRVQKWEYQALEHCPVPIHFWKHFVDDMLTCNDSL